MSSRYLAAAIFVAGCSTQSTPETIPNGFLTPTADGAFPLALTGSHQGVVADAYAFQIGFQQDVGLRAYSGLLPDVTIAGDPLDGAVFNARFTGAIAEDLRIEPDSSGVNDLLKGTNTRFEGDITLTVFEGGTRINGTGDGLTVEGRLDGQKMAGTVTFADVTGELQGQTGQQRTVGAFYGSTEETVYTGGFTGNAR